MAGRKGKEVAHDRLSGSERERSVAFIARGDSAESRQSTKYTHGQACLHCSNRATGLTLLPILTKAV